MEWTARMALITQREAQGFRTPHFTLKISIKRGRMSLADEVCARATTMSPLRDHPMRTSRSDPLCVTAIALMPSAIRSLDPCQPGWYCAPVCAVSILCTVSGRSSRVSP